jgi:hypothetical protein
MSVQVTSISVEMSIGVVRSALHAAIERVGRADVVFVLLEQTIERVGAGNLTEAVLGWVPSGPDPGESLGLRLAEQWSEFEDPGLFDWICSMVYATASDAVCAHAGLPRGSSQLAVFQRVATLAEGVRCLASEGEAG